MMVWSHPSVNTISSPNLCKISSGIMAPRWGLRAKARQAISSCSDDSLQYPGGRSGAPRISPVSATTWSSHQSLILFHVFFNPPPLISWVSKLKRMVPSFGAGDYEAEFVDRSEASMHGKRTGWHLFYLYCYLIQISHDNKQLLFDGLKDVLGPACFW